jgi:hypothetical protein
VDERLAAEEVDASSKRTPVSSVRMYAARRHADLKDDAGTGEVTF